MELPWKAQGFRTLSTHTVECRTLATTHRSVGIASDPRTGIAEESSGEP